MAAPKAQDCHALITYYENAYQAKYDEKPVVNRNKARWSFSDILMGISSKEAKELIDYYLETPGTVHGHKLQWFLNNYDKLAETRALSLEDAERRAKLRKESEERAREWREKRGYKGIANN